METDLLVVGGGSTGAGVAWDAALRGLGVVLVEAGELASGTTGRFHGLLHSGARYAVADPVAATECREENAILRRVAAPWIEDTGGLFVVAAGDDHTYAQRWAEACAALRIPAVEIGAEQARREEPGLNPRVIRVFRVRDAAVDAAGVVRACARAARRRRARVLTNHRVVRLLVERDAVAGAVVRRAAAAGEEQEIRAAAVINAAGAWADEVAALAHCRVKVVTSRGVMVATTRVARMVLNRCRAPSDGDILVPMGGESVMGTSDRPAAGPGDLEVPEGEVDRMLEEGEQLVPQLRGAGITRAWAAVRPLFEECREGSGDHRGLTRSWALLDHAERDGVGGLLTITGGKFTTFRRMAEATVDQACSWLGVTSPCHTAIEALPSEHA